jgi:hypothetical protein
MQSDDNLRGQNNEANDYTSSNGVGQEISRGLIASLIEA